MAGAAKLKATPPQQRVHIYEDRRVYVRTTPVRTDSYPMHFHVVAISDNGNGWTDPHPDGTRHQVRELEFLPAVDRQGRSAKDDHRHDIDGRASTGTRKP
ncbi:MAG: hypothetical protein JO086_00040 [Acidimicrobiia bacterium]|nr:hypothetical protein [Acidimicrobiia bacterium]